jgi:sec-independent protein translocase protein TatB
MNLGITEMIFLFVLGLLLFGPKKLPEIGRQLGKALAEFKRASNEFQSQLNDEVRKLEIEETVAKVTAEPPAGTAARGSDSAPPEGVEGTGLTPSEHPNG